MTTKITYSTGRDRSKLHTYASHLDFFVRNRRLSERIYTQAFETVLRIAQTYCPGDLRAWRLLDIGCGQRFAAVLLFHSLGANITGIDADYVDPGFSLKGYWSIWKRNGLERCVKTVLRHQLFDKGFYAGLAQCFQREAGRRLCWDGLDLRQMNACDLKFPADHFDFAFSRAVFEHIDNVPAACRELQRVLKPGGVAYIEAHLFPSLSGGHHFEWAKPSEERRHRVPPWDHLRQNKYPSAHYLNRLREAEYLDCFETYFKILDTRCAYEGEQHLTAEILAELPDYPRDELLKKSLCVVLQKRAPQPCNAA
jgi:SAM-dependent methyltransferase